MHSGLKVKTWFGFDLMCLAEMNTFFLQKSLEGMNVKLFFLDLFAIDRVVGVPSSRSFQRLEPTENRFCLSTGPPKCIWTRHRLLLTSNGFLHYSGPTVGLHPDRLPTDVRYS